MTRRRHSTSRIPNPPTRCSSECPSFCNVSCIRMVFCSQYCLNDGMSIEFLPLIICGLFGNSANSVSEKFQITFGVIAQWLLELFLKMYFYYWFLELYRKWSKLKTWLIGHARTVTITIIFIEIWQTFSRLFALCPFDMVLKSQPIWAALVIGEKQRSGIHRLQQLPHCMSRFQMSVAVFSTSALFILTHWKFAVTDLEAIPSDS